MPGLTGMRTLYIIMDKFYQSTKKNGTKPTNGNIASMNGIKKETMEEYLKNHDFEKVEK